MLRQKKESRSIFRKHLLLFIITILLPTIVLLSIQVYRVSQEAVAQTENAAAGQLDRAARNLDMLLDQLNQISLQISLTPDVLDLLTRPFDQPAYQYAQIRDQLKSWMPSNPLFYSMYLDILQNRKVLTTGEGIYDEVSFYDKAFMEQLRSGQGHAGTSGPWIGLRQLPDATPSEVLTFARGIPATQPTPLGLLVFNIRKDVFVNTLQTLYTTTSGPMLAFDPEGTLISAPIPGLNAGKIAGELASGATHKEAIELAGSKYLLVGEKIPTNGWTLLQLTPFDSYNRKMANAIRQAAIVLVLVFCGGIGLAYFFASILYDPWRRLAERLQGSAQVPQPSGRDAYSFVNSAIHDLLAVIRQNEPIVRDHLVHDLLHGHLAGDDAAERFREAGMQFVYPHFAVLVVTVEAADEAEQSTHRGLYLYSLAEEKLRSHFAAAGTILDRERFGFILNLDGAEFAPDLKALVENACRDIQSTAGDRFQASMSFCVSGIRTLQRLPEAYEQVKRALAYKAFLSSDIYFADDNPESMTLQYPASYQKLVLGSILAGDRELAEGYVSELFDRYLTTAGYPYSKLLQMIVMLMSHVLGSLVQEGFDIGPLMNEIDLLQLQRCHNRQELQALILSQIGRVIAYLDSARERAGNYGAFVDQAIGFIERHYADNISITDIAASIGISASHLSRVFKAEVGRPPLEYLTEHRLRLSKELLRDRSKPLQQISQLVGYNDVHTFIRSFKKSEGTTPGEYRKRLMDLS